MQCPRCQQENPEGQKFCGECGAPLQSPSGHGQAATSYADVQSALTEAFAQQTATADILRVISTSPTDVQLVFDAIAESARRLCNGEYCVVESFDGECLHFGASDGLSPEGLAAFRQALPRPVSEDNAAGRAVLRRMVAQIPDVLEDPTHGVRSVALAANYRSAVAVPMLRLGQPIGAIVVARSAVGLLPERQIALLQTFADQAVIAIENVRLFKELQTSNSELTEALDQQTATSEILRVISSSPTDIQPVFDAVAESAARLCEAYDSTIFRRDDDQLLPVAHHGAIPQTSALPLVRGTVAGRTVLDGRTVHIADVQTETEEFPESSENARRLGFRTILVVPLMREGVAIGTITLRRTEARLFTDRQVALLQTFADQAVIAIENVRLFTELQEKNGALTQAHAQVTEALEQQTATSDILRVISSSPTDVQPVFDAIVRSAVRLCGGLHGVVDRFDGELIHFVAQYNYTPEALQMTQRMYPRRPDRQQAAGRAILTGDVVNIADVQADPEYMTDLAVAGGWRSVLNVPMLREGKPIGTIGVIRGQAGWFSDAQVELLRTFADQAVIAIENVRLFTELQEKNKALTAAHAQVSESLDQQTATSEILRVISGAHTDAQPVFDTIVRSAARLCRATTAAVFLSDGKMLHRLAIYGGASSPEVRAALAGRYPRPLDMETATGITVLTRSLVHVPDIEDPSVVESARQTGRLVGFRSMLSVPMLRHGEAVGAINVSLREPGRFSDAEVELLKTFADQAVIAVENVRLFKELEAANRELAAASQHKSEFLANMSHELRTPLNAIIGFSEVLSERMFGELNEKQEEYSKDIHASGQHLLSLINDILDLSKIEAGRMELELSDFHLPTALDSALTLVRERAGRRGIALQMNIDERLGQIQADERKVRQVVLNLLSNAIKFTPEGGRVEVTAVPKDGFVEVSVSDTGVGIAPEDQEKVFEEFRQVGTADKKAEGTGLGLTLCRKFIELHGGKIWVKSQLGMGSIFTFTIPVRYGE